MDKIKVIDRDTFDMSVHYGSHFKGYVMGLGYVTWSRIVPYSDAPAHPFDTSRYSQNNISYLGEEVFVPNIIPEEDILADVTIPDKDILDAMLEYKVEGKMVMTLFDGRKVELDSQHTNFRITTRDEYYHGEDTRTVTVVAKDKANNIQVETKTSIHNVIIFIGEKIDYVAYPGAFWEYQIARHLEKNKAWRPAKTMDGYIKARGTSKYRFGFLSGEQAFGVFKVLKGIGIGTGLFGIGYTGHQYFYQNSISKEQAIADALFGIIGFMGVPGLVFSSLYFIISSPNSNRNTKITPYNYDTFTLPRDNTQVVIPYHSRYR